MNNNPYKVVTATYTYFGYKVFNYAKTTYCTALGFVEIKPEEKIKQLEDFVSYDHRKTAFIYDLFSKFFVKHYPFQLDLFENNIDHKKYFNNHYNDFDDLNFDEKEYQIAFIWEAFLDKHLKKLTDLSGRDNWFVNGVIHLVTSGLSDDLSKTKKNMTARINSYLEYYLFNHIQHNE